MGTFYDQRLEMHVASAIASLKTLRYRTRTKTRGEVGYLKSDVKQMRQIKDLAKQKWQFDITKKRNHQRFVHSLQPATVIPSKDYSGDQIKEISTACSTYGVRTGAYRCLVVKPEGKRPLGRPRRRWKDNIKMDLQEVGWGHGLD
jgi:hypothetical protein